MHVGCKASAASSRRAQKMLTRSPCWARRGGVNSRIVVVVRAGWWMAANLDKAACVCLAEAVGQVETGPQTASGWDVCMKGA